MDRIIKDKTKKIRINYLRKISSLTKFITRINKRIFDILIAFVALILLIPLFLLIAVFLHRDSSGPTFFRCNRMGKGGKPFKMIKFRTMYEVPNSYQGPPVTCKQDDRITPFGRWLRETKINELPQLWNVLVGEMSLVGPRPEDVNIANQWPKNVFKEVLSMRPGITSPASILYHDEENMLSKEHLMEDYFKEILPDKMRLDQLYVRNHSFTADIDIIFWTIAILIPRIAKIKIPENLLFFGPFSRFSHRYLYWFLIDLVIALFSVTVVSLLWRVQIPLNWGFNYLVIFAFVLALLFSGVNAISGVRRILWSRATTNDGLSLLLSSSLVILLVLTVNYIQSFFYWYEIPPLPVFMLLAIGILTQLGFIAVRFRFRIFTAIASRWMNIRRLSLGVGERILIIGLGDGFESAVWQFRSGEYSQIFSIVGAVDDNPSVIGMVVNDCRVLGTMADVPEIIIKYDIGILVFTGTNIDPKDRRDIQKSSKTSELKIIFINEWSEILNKQISHSPTIPDKVLWSNDRLKYLVTHDAITGLPNQFLFNEHLKHSLAIAQRNQTMTAIMLINLNGNLRNEENCDKNYDEEILKQVAKRLEQYKRNSDTLAYLENGEFGLILENMGGKENIGTIVKRINQTFSQPIKVNKDQIIVSPNISFSTDLTGFEEILKENEKET